MMEVAAVGSVVTVTASNMIVAAAKPTIKMLKNIAVKVISAKFGRIKKKLLQRVPIVQMSDNSRDLKRIVSNDLRYAELAYDKWLKDDDDVDSLYTAKEYSLRALVSAQNYEDQLAILLGVCIISTYICDSMIQDDRTGMVTSYDVQRGKTAAQELLGRHVFQHKKLDEAVDAELGMSKNEFYKYPTKRYVVLALVVELNELVAALAPYDADPALHPLLPTHFPKAIFKLAQSSEGSQYLGEISHLLAQAGSGPVRFGKVLNFNKMKRIQCLAIAGESKVLVGCLQGVACWDLIDNKKVDLSKRISALCCDASIYQDKARGITGGKHGSLVLWDLDQNTTLCAFDIKGDFEITFVAMSGDGFAVSADSTGRVRSWDLVSFEKKWEIDTHVEITCSVMSSHLLYTGSSSAETPLLVWDTLLGVETALSSTLSCQLNEGIVWCALTCNDTRLTVITVSSTCFIYELRVDLLLNSYRLNLDDVLCCWPYGSSCLMVTCNNFINVSATGKKAYSIQGNLSLKLFNANHSFGLSIDDESKGQLWRLPVMVEEGLIQTSFEVSRASSKRLLCQPSFVTCFLTLTSMSMLVLCFQASRLSLLEISYS